MNNKRVHCQSYPHARQTHTSPELPVSVVIHYMTLYHQKCRKRLRDFFLWKIFLWVLYDNIGTLVCPEHPHVTMVFQKHFKRL